MQFDSFESFLAMGKYGFYVWLSFGLSFLLLTLLVVFSLLSKKAIKQRIYKQYLREQKLKAAHEQQNSTH